MSFISLPDELELVEFLLSVLGQQTEAATRECFLPGMNKHSLLRLRRGPIRLDISSLSLPPAVCMQVLAMYMCVKPVVSFGSHSLGALPSHWDLGLADGVRLSS